MFQIWQWKKDKHLHVYKETFKTLKKLTTVSSTDIYYESSTFIAMETITSLSDFFAAKGFSRRTIQAANSAMSVPCPRSPNIIAKRNGNVMIVYGAGKQATDVFK
jgi:hypothetical protein